MRCIPNVQVIRPADGNETAAAWKLALETTDKPTILVLSRQNLPVLEGTTTDVFEKVAKGGYIVSDSEKAVPEGILIATGSEVSLAVQAQKALQAQGQDVRVVSLPSFDLFEQQSAAYKEAILPQAVTKRVAVEAGVTFGWERYVGSAGKIIGIDHFGASAPGDRILKEFGFTVGNVVNMYSSL